jgi:phosphoglycolate phosphatase
MYQYVFFDLDGTLTDSAKGILNAVEYALGKYGIVENNAETLNAFIGPPLHDSFVKYYGFDDKKADEAVAIYREYFSVKGLFENDVYDGVEEMLTKLKERGKKLVIATSKPEVFTFRILKHFDLERYFDFIAGATLDISRAKKADVIAYALEKVNPEDKEKVIMVGDREHDVLGAKQNGLTSLGVLFGYGDVDELKSAGADYIVKDVLELKEFLCR